MSQGIKRGKSPAARNRFNNIGITGRKTGVRVAGNVLVDEDGLENVDEFYKRTSPLEPPVKAPTLRTLVSPTPIRKQPSHDTLLGALDLSSLPSKRGSTKSPARNKSPTNNWIRSPKRSRRVTTAENPSDTGEFTSATAINDSEEDDELAEVKRIDNGNEEDTPMESDDINLDHVNEEAGPIGDSVENTEEHIEEHTAEPDEPIEEYDDVRIEELTEEPIEEHIEEPIEEPTEEPIEDTETRIEEPIGEDSEGQSEDQLELAESVGDVKRPSEKRIKKPKEKHTPVRRSTRTSVPPLAFWRNEHIEYEYDNRVPKVKNVVRVRHTAEEKQKRRRKRKQLPGLSSIKPTEVSDLHRFYYYDDENYGFSYPSHSKFGPKRLEKRSADRDDDDIAMTTEKIPVLVEGKEQAEEIVLSRHDIEWTKPNQKYQVGMGLVSEDAGASSGVLSLAVNGSKPQRSSGNSSLFYLVTSGQVEFHIHSSKFDVGILGQVVVPPNNTYTIKNIGTHPAQLYYVQIGIEP